MSRRAWVICVLLVLLPCAGQAQFDDDKLVREYAKTLAKDKDAKDRADAAHWLGGRKNPEAVAALAKALSDPEASVRQAAASALWKTGEGAAAAKPELLKALADPDVRERFTAQGLTIRGSSPEELGVATRAQLAKYARVMKEANIRND